MSENSRRVGVFGGTFDPIHIGHLVAAVNVRHALDLEVVLVVVANRPWQKEGDRSITPAVDRFAVVEAAVSDVPGIEASDIEIRRGGNSYTADTLSELGGRLTLVIGADVAASLDTWDRIDEVRARCRLAVVSRAGAASPSVPHGWHGDVIDIPALEVSSTDIRERIAEGRPVDYLIPDAAMREIRRRGLYARGR